MNGADLFEDGYPHGTVQGFIDGCRGGACPAARNYGISCKRAKALAAGDHRYNKLVKAGAPPAAIALELGEVEPEQLEPDVLALVDAYHNPPAVDELPAPKTSTEKTRPQLIREWCAREGIDVNAFGRIPRAIIDRFDQAHGTAAANPYTDVLDEARDRATETTPAAAQPLAESSQNRTTPHETSDAPSESPAPAELDDAGRREEMGHPTLTPDAIATLIRQEVIACGPFHSLGNATAFETNLREARGLSGQAHWAHLDGLIWPEPLSIYWALPADQRPKTLTPDPHPGDVDEPRPEWAEVAISVHVERARNTAVRLEQELARAEEQLAAATAENERLQGALTFALRAWARQRELAATRTAAANAWHIATKALEKDITRLHWLRRIDADKIRGLGHKLDLAAATQHLATTALAAERAKPRWKRALGR